jgi:hypothetical protein
MTERCYRALSPIIAVVGLMAACMVSPSLAAEASKPPAATVLLDTQNAMWRCRMVRATSEFLTAPGKVERVMYRNITRDGHNLWRKKKVFDPGDYKIVPLKNFRMPETTDPNWMLPEFDDGEWCRQPGATGTGVDPGWKLMLMRGRFTVSDPAQCEGMKLSVIYRGGVIVYLNGKEIARRHLPEGELDMYALAEPYPEAMYLEADGRLRRRPGRDARDAKPFTDFNRVMKDVLIPASALRKGVNVLAVAAHRSPTDKAVLLRAEKTGRHITRFGPEVGWSTVGIMSVRLSAPPKSAARPESAVRPEGLTVWNSSEVQNVFHNEPGPGLAPLRPVRMVTPRGGAGVGQVIAGARTALKGISVRVTDLNGPAKLPASSVQVRYTLLTGYVAPRGNRSRGPTSYDTLAEAPPQAIAVNGATGLAIQPLWITVHVPRDAKPGEYTGTLTVSAADQKPVTVPLALHVAAWTLPPIDEWATHNDFVQSPESVAMRYGVELWSDKHFELLDKTFQLLAPTGDKTLYITAVRRTHWGNEHAMVRWTRGEDGDLEPDLSIVEKYIDTARKHMGRIPSVILYAWEPPYSMGHAGNPTAVSRTHDRAILLTLKSKRSGGGLRAIVGPAWGSPESRQLWSKLVKGMNALLEKRGMKGSLLFGLLGDHRATKRAMDDISTAARKTLWAVHSHFYATEHMGYKVGMCSAVWGIGCSPRTPEHGGSGYGWKSEFRLMPSSRSLRTERTPLVGVRTYIENWLGAVGRKPELNGCKGLGRAGADFWPVIKDSRGNYRWVLAARYPESAWGQLSLHNCNLALLAPGKDGPLSTVRAENIRAAVQEIEARVFIERALLDKDARARLGNDLASRCRQVIDNRIRAVYYGWSFFLGLGYREHAELLYDLAHQVALKTAKGD